MSTMKIQMRRVDDAFHFEARNEDGRTVDIDAAQAVGGRGEGVRPMQLLVMGLGGCSGIDLLSILKKGRHEVQDLQIELEAQRAEGQVPALFTRIHVHYALTGPLQPEAVRRAVELSLGKYCSVAKILEKTATITYAYSINGTRHA